MELELETRCTKCRRRWIPVHRDYVTGQWRTCPRCRTAVAPRDPPAATGIRSHVDSTQGLTDDSTAPVSGDMTNNERNEP